MLKASSDLVAQHWDKPMVKTMLQHIVSYYLGNSSSIERKLPPLSELSRDII